MGDVLDLFAHRLEKVGVYDGYFDSLPTYLFRTKNGDEPFIEIMRDFCHWNNYLISMWNIEHDEFDVTDHSSPNGRTSFEEKFGQADFDGEMEYEKSFADYVSGDMNEFVSLANAANTVVVTYFLFIRSLKKICEWAEPEMFVASVKEGRFRNDEYKEIKRILSKNSKGESDKEFDRKNFDGVKRKIKKVRDAYSHGEWDNVAFEMRTVQIRQVFAVLSVFFEGLENVTTRNDPPGTILI